MSESTNKLTTYGNLSKYNDLLYEKIGKQWDYSVGLTRNTEALDDGVKRYQALIKLKRDEDYKFIICREANSKHYTAEVVVNSNIFSQGNFSGFAINSDEYYIVWSDNANPYLGVAATDAPIAINYKIKVVSEGSYGKNWQTNITIPEDPIYITTGDVSSTTGFAWQIPNISTKIINNIIDSQAYTTETITTTDGTGVIDAGDYIDYIIDNSDDSSATQSITIKDGGELKDGVYRFAIKGNIDSFTLTDGDIVTTYNETPVYKDGILTYTKVTNESGTVTASFTYDAPSMYSSDLSINISTDSNGKTDFTIGNKNLDQQYVGLDYSKYDDSWIYAPLTVFEAYNGTTNFTNQVLIKTKEASGQTYKDMVDLTDDNTVKSKWSSTGGKIKYSATILLENSPAIYDMYQIIINSTLGEAHILKLTNGNNVIAEPFLAKYNNASNVYMYGIRIKDASVATLTAYSEKYGVNVINMVAAGVYSCMLSESLEFGLLNRCCPMNGYIYSSFSPTNWTILDNISYNIKDVQNTAGTSLVDWSTSIATVAANTTSTLSLATDGKINYLTDDGGAIPVSVLNDFITQHNALLEQLYETPAWDEEEGEGGEVSQSRKYVIPRIEVSETDYSIDPNKFYVWEEVTELNITLNDPADTTIYNEYMFQFTSGDTATELSLPEDITWYLDDITILANHTYQISIVENMAILSEF